MRKYLKYTSLFGFMGLYGITATKLLTTHKFLLFYELQFKALIWWIGYLIIPAGVLVIGIDKLLGDMWFVKNILYCVVYLLLYLSGVLIMDKFLKWRKDKGI